MTASISTPLKTLVLATSLLLLPISPTLAEDAAKEKDDTPNFAEDTLTGDWGWARTAAAKNGFGWEGGFKLDTLSNHGAQSKGTRSVSHLDLKLKMDLEKAMGWNGGSALINVISNSGIGPNAQHVGSQMGVTNIEVGSPSTTRLFQAWVQQSLFDDQLAVLFGLYPIDSEFFTMDSAGVFLGPQYGTPADLAQTKGGTGPSIFNNSALGVRARWAITPTVYAMGALLDGVPNDPNHPKRTTIRLGNGDGTMSIGEIGWLPQAEDEKFKGHAKVAAGLWGYSARVDDQLDLDGNGNPIARRSRGGYVLGESTLLRFDEDRFLSGFARYTWTDGDSTAVKNSLNLGVHVKGLWASRPDDIFGVAWTRAGLSSKWRDAEALLGNDTKRSEDALELTYRIALTPYLAIQPHFQYMRHPGGDASVSNAKLIGFRLDLAL